MDLNNEYFKALKELEPIILKYEKGNIEVLYKDLQVNQQLILIYLETFSNAKAKYPQWHRPPTALFYKFFSHVNSICELFKGTNTFIAIDKTNVKTVDRSGTIIMHRALMETYLTLYHLYFDRVSDDIKNMRQMFYEVQGMKKRSKFAFTEKNAQILAKEEEIKASKLSIELNNDINYRKIDKKVRSKAEKNRSGLMVSTYAILKNCDLDETIFSMSYNLASDHAHSEYISNTQIMTGIVENTDWTEHIRLIWFQIAILQACFIRNIKTYIPASSLIYLSNEYSKVEKELLMMCNLRSDKRASIVHHT
jgi:hypothetical protein